MASIRRKIGLWMVGACGGVGSTVALGIAAMRKNLAEPAGLVTDLPAFSAAGLVAPGSIVVGGHEIRSESLLEAVRTLHKKAGLFDEALIRSCAPALRAMQRNIRPGTLIGATPVARDFADRDGLAGDKTAAATVERLRRDISRFRSRHRLDSVVVIHVASCERPIPRRPAHRSYAGLKRSLTRKGSCVIPPSSLYALAAIEERCPFVNFTASLGADIAAIRERADELNVPYMGSDGKTGETLVKTVLAPMFAMRNLPVLSWVGQNILGNRDGVALKDPRTRQSKLRSKDRAVSQIIDPPPTTHVSIDYVPSLHDWKVAWDFIHFKGFLDTKMSLQFTWHGSDSVLAAPLVIDLARLADLQLRRGAGGPMRHLAFFFKDPMDVEGQSLFTQWQMLVDHVNETRL